MALVVIIAAAIIMTIAAMTHVEKEENIVDIIEMIAAVMTMILAALEEISEAALDVAA